MGLKYWGEAGDDGCMFVEGHKELSYKTAERYVDRGIFKRVNRPTRNSFRATKHDDDDAEDSDVEC